jgi:hypothetical protein
LKKKKSSFCQYGNYCINNFQLQAQELPSHQLNTNLTSSNILQNCINAIHEDTLLESMENSLDHQIKYFEQLKDTSIHPCVCFHWLCFRKQVIKIYKIMIEKYCLDIPIGEIKPLLCKSYYSFSKKKWHLPLKKLGFYINILG